MKIGVVSDIHSNATALLAVLEDTKKNKVDKIICLGDVIGYGPNPGLCLDLVYDNCFGVIRGNHEEALLDKEVGKTFNLKARKAIDWTREIIHSEGDEETKAHRLSVLKNLKTQAVLNDLKFVHGSPSKPTREYVFPKDLRNQKKMQRIFSDFDHICFNGHTHLPGVYLEDGTFQNPKELFGNTYFVSSDEKALINVGSVGQPRDRDVRACYCIIDLASPDDVSVKFRRVEYDVDSVVKKILANPILDNSLAQRLTLGR